MNRRALGPIIVGLMVMLLIAFLVIPMLAVGGMSLLFLLERLSFNRQKPEGLRVIEKIQSHASTIMGWEIAFHAYRRIGNGQKLT